MWPFRKQRGAKAEERALLERVFQVLAKIEAAYHLRVRP